MMESLHLLGPLERFLAGIQVTNGSYPPESVYHAIVLADLGRMQVAKSMLAALSASTSEPWRAKITEVERRLEARPE
jgi:hypothetical protein